SAHSVGVLAFSTVTATASAAWHGRATSAARTIQTTTCHGAAASHRRWARETYALQLQGARRRDAAAPAALCQRRIDVPRIGARRQRHQPVGDLGGAELAPVLESQALSQGGFERPVADGGTAGDAGA